MSVKALCIALALIVGGMSAGKADHVQNELLDGAVMLQYNICENTVTGQVGRCEWYTKDGKTYYVQWYDEEVDTIWLEQPDGDWHVVWRVDTEEA